MAKLDCVGDDDYIDRDPIERLGYVTRRLLEVVVLWRRDRGMTQKEFACYLGMTPSRWNKIESGKATLRFEVFLDICWVMEVSYADLIEQAFTLAEAFGRE